MTFTVYRTTNLVNSHYYIGVHKTSDPEDSYLGSGKIINAAIKKYGKAAFVKRVLFQFSASTDAYAKEIDLLKEARQDPHCYNIHEGGKGGFEYINASGMNGTGRQLIKDGQKYCPACEKWLPLDDFGKCKYTLSGKRGRCHKCLKEQNAPHMRRYMRRYQRGIDDAGLLALEQKQGGCCAICRDTLSSESDQGRHIDRDRVTRGIRGLLCPKCKLGLINFRDNQVLILQAINYLRNFEIERRERRQKEGGLACLSPA